MVKLWTMLPRDAVDFPTLEFFLFVYLFFKHSWTNPEQPDQTWKISLLWVWTWWPPVVQPKLFYNLTIEYQKMEHT